MLAFQQVREVAFDQDSLRGELETMMKRYIVPELESDHPFLRARACIVCDHFGERTL